jgi:hypothetical protein
MPTDADGHILEPIDLGEKYIDPAYRDRAPRLFVDTDGKERLRVGETGSSAAASCRRCW